MRSMLCIRLAGLRRRRRAARAREECLLDKLRSAQVVRTARQRDASAIPDAALASSWALRSSYLFTRDNLPAPGFEKDDATTAVSLVWKR